MVFTDIPNMTGSLNDCAAKVRDQGGAVRMYSGRDAMNGK
jgi:hypothetical protein